MNKFVSSPSLLAFAALGLSLGFSSAPARADIGFQPVVYTGSTFEQPAVIHYPNGTNAFGTRYVTTPDVVPVAYAPAPVPAPVPVYMSTVWQSAGIQHIPARFGDLNVLAENSGAIWRYTIALNGHPLLRADNQPGALQIAGVYPLDGEDAVVLTAWRGEASCPYRSYLLTVRADGFIAAPREMDSCANAPTGRVVNSALFVSFSHSPDSGVLSTWDVWRNENMALARL